MAWGRILSFVAFAGGWIISGVRFVLDLIGYATIPDDAKVAAALVDKAFIFLLATPGWLVYGGALIITLGLMHYSWPRAPKNKALKVAPPSRDQKLAELGEDCRVTAGNVRSWVRSNYGGLRTVPSSAESRLEVMILKLAREGIPAPVGARLSNPDVANKVVDYLTKVGALLSASLIADANEKAGVLTDEIMRLSASLSRR